MWITLVPEIFDIKTYLGFTDYVGFRGVILGRRMIEFMNIGKEERNSIMTNPLYYVARLLACTGSPPLPHHIHTRSAA